MSSDVRNANVKCDVRSVYMCVCVCIYGRKAPVKPFDRSYIGYGGLYLAGGSAIYARVFMHVFARVMRPPRFT